MYRPHPSQALMELFQQKPYQGADPMEAEFLFVGLDANYDEHIQTSSIFDSVSEYHQNGVSFWRKHGVHHPFLLPGYTGDGRRYHRNFARIGFAPKHADLVSFIEILPVPTVGRSGLDAQDLDYNHLQTVNFAITNGRAKYTFISAGVARLMHESRAFPWLSLPCKRTGTLRVLHTDGKRNVYLHLHLSNYGKFEKQMVVEAKAINSLIPLDAS